MKLLKSKIIICQGIQGSGKSTWARRWVNESPETRVRINNDDIRRMLGSYWCPNREKLVNEIKTQSIKISMKQGFDIIIDNMNLNPRELRQLENLVEIHNSWVKDDTIQKSDEIYWEYTIEYQQFKTPLEECIMRDSMRDMPIGEDVIRHTYEKYKEFYEKIE